MALWLACRTPDLLVFYLAGVNPVVFSSICFTLAVHSLLPVVVYCTGVAVNLMMHGKRINMWIHIQCHCFNQISIVPQFWYNSFITCYWLDLLITVIHLPSCIYCSLCSVKALLSQVLKLRSTNWGFSGTQGSAGVYLPHPANDEYYISDYSLAMVC